MISKMNTKSNAHITRPPRNRLGVKAMQDINSARREQDPKIKEALALPKIKVSHDIR